MHVLAITPTVTAAAEVVLTVDRAIAAAVVAQRHPALLQTGGCKQDAVCCTVL